MSEQRFRLRCGYVTAIHQPLGEGQHPKFNDWKVQFLDEHGKTRWFETLPASMFLSVFEPVDAPTASAQEDPQR